MLIRLLLVAVVLGGGYFDWRFRRIPNWVTVTGFLTGFLLNTVGAGRTGMVESLEGTGLALLIYIPLYLLRGMGAGDVKMMAAVGAITGPAGWLIVFLATSLLGGVAAFSAVVVKKRLHQTWFNVQTLLGSLMRFEAPYQSNSDLDIRGAQSLRLPHGVVIACGSLLCVCAGWLKH